MHFTKRLTFTFFKNIFCTLLYLVISISLLTKLFLLSNELCVYSTEFSEAWKYFEIKEKGVIEIAQPSYRSWKPARSISAEMWAHLSIHRSGWRVRPWSNSRCTTHINAKYTHAFARARAGTCVCERACASARPRANAYTLVIILHTHVRVVRGVVLRPPPFPLNTDQQPPFPRCNRQTSQFPSRLPLQPACPPCYTWSPPVRSVLSSSRDPLLPFTSLPSHSSDVTRSLTILCSRHWP